MSVRLAHVAYLGPRGSHTELALRAQYEVSSATPLLSIAQVFEALRSGSSALGFVPLENMLEGPVTETLDQLFAASGRIQIVDSVTCTIEHALGTRTDIPLEEVERVYSHQQALRQCAEFLDRHCPKAERIATASTSAAASLLVEHNDAQAAVIASTACLEEHQLHLRASDIANAASNKTRFALIAAEEMSIAHKEQKSRYVTSVALDPSRDRQGILHEVLQVLSLEHRCNLLSIHSRPDQRGGFVFFLDIEGASSSPQIADALAGLEQYCQTATGRTAVLTRFGSYRFEPFHRPAFSRIGIVGVEGRMGSWFKHFFETLGFDCIGCDTGSELSLEDVVSRSDALLLSVPMSEMPKISTTLAPLLRAGQLVVENSSIKHSSIPFLEKALPNGVELLGIHTMFGEQVSSIRDQNVIVTKTASSGEKAQAFEDILYKQGAALSPASLQEHDRASASLQAMLHLLLLSTATVLEREWQDSEALLAFNTPNSRALLEAMARVAQQSDELVLDMQRLNPMSEVLRHELLAELFRQVFALDNGEEQSLRAALASARRFFEIRDRSKN